MSNRNINIDLEFPVSWNGKEVKAIAIRRPKGRDMRWLPDGKDESVEAMYPFFAMLVTANGEPVTEDFIDEMDAADIGAVGTTVTGFLEKAAKGARGAKRKAGAR
jgi:hypothetical protein